MGRFARQRKGERFFALLRVETVNFDEGRGPPKAASRSIT
jgi:transcription termination factor Rho